MKPKTPSQLLASLATAVLNGDPDKIEAIERASYAISLEYKKFNDSCVFLKIAQAASLYYLAIAARKLGHAIRSKKYKKRAKTEHDKAKKLAEQWVAS